MVILLISSVIRDMHRSLLVIDDALQQCGVISHPRRPFPLIATVLRCHEDLITIDKDLLTRGWPILQLCRTRRETAYLGRRLVFPPNQQCA